MEKKFFIFNLFLIFVIFVCSVLIVVENGFVHGKVTDGTVTSNVSIAKSVAVSFSSSLEEGIVFEEIHILPADNTTAVHNYDGVNNASTYYILVSGDGNSDVDLCIRSSGNLTSIGGDWIELSNETYAFSLNDSNLTLPNLNLEVPFTQTYSEFASSLTPGENSYLRFWLDVPANQPSGTYSNLIYFKAVPTLSGC